MVVQGAAPKEGWGTGADMSDQLTPRQMFCAPLLSALLFGGGSAGISDIYVHIRDIVPLNARDWESNPLERRLARWHTSLARAINDFVRLGVLKEDGHAKWAVLCLGRVLSNRHANVEFSEDDALCRPHGANRSIEGCFSWKAMCHSQRQGNIPSGRV